MHERVTFITLITTVYAIATVLRERALLMMMLETGHHATPPTAITIAASRPTTPYRLQRAVRACC